ncbi:hypothetical protein QAD02_014811 [Eretmocerus hayati]|uniref:Uncharacterized protein n=1 Tax=Eretmocerus hayati TaxID=131215 RepID=A0ACC2P8T5_9HYME|nr:hypothetical protein QAD02_014811 [Eretmocerus hayati]
MDPTHDSTYLGILQTEKNIANFLDSFFGFLYRCTDFYIETTADQRLGFPPGFAEKLVVNTLQKWQNLKKVPESSIQLADPPPAIQECTVTSDNSIGVYKNLESSLEKSDRDIAASKADKKPQIATKKRDESGCYNGASYDNYRWSQSINELDVQVHVPEDVRSSKQVRVGLEADKLEVSILQPLQAHETQNTAYASSSQWNTIVKGDFAFKVKSSESYWCLEPGKHINIHLEKGGERWWDCLLTGEPKIELSKIDCSRNLSEMGEIEQMKVEELMWNQRRKLLGQPTSEEMRMEQILQKAWNAEGSPFKDTEYDPSLVKFN